MLTCGFDEEQSVHARFDNACSQGVSLPENWKTAIQCVGLHDKAKVAVKRMKEDLFVHGHSRVRVHGPSEARELARAGA